MVKILHNVTHNKDKKTNYKLYKLPQYIFS